MLTCTILYSLEFLVYIFIMVYEFTSNTVLFPCSATFTLVFLQVINNFPLNSMLTVFSKRPPVAAKRHLTSVQSGLSAGTVCSYGCVNAGLFAEWNG